MAVVEAARAIIIKDDHLLVIRRSKPNGQTYMVTPGGRLEAGETAEEAVIRELVEETTVLVKNPRLVFIEDPNDDVWGTQYIFLCDYVSGEPQLHPDSEELMIQSQGGGTYEPMWFPVDRIPDEKYIFRSERLGYEIKNGHKNGFSDQPKRWSL